MLDGKEKIMTIDSIKRYTVSGDIAYPVHEDPEGDYVTYEDHVAAIEADRKRRGEPVKRKRRYAQGTALGEFGVIPMCDQVDDEPVKALSDDDIYRLANDFSGMTFEDLDVVAFGRALLARYGKGQT